MKEKSPAFQWYPKDCDTDENVRAMDDREFGFYVRCLNHSWLNSGLPSDPAEIMRILGRPKFYIDKVWPRVAKCFHIQGDRLTNNRQEEEREKQREHSQKQSENGKAGMKKRWGDHNDTNRLAITTHITKNNSAFASAIAIKETAPLPPSEFDFQDWLTDLRNNHPGPKGTEGSCRVNAQLVLQNVVDISATAERITHNHGLWIESWNGTAAKYIPALPNWLVRVDAGGRTFPCLETPPPSAAQIETARIVEDLCKRAKTV